MSSDLVNGPVAVGIRQTLPFKGVHLLLGNDLAGDKVVVNPLITDTPCMDQSPDPIEQELPDLYTSCAVTRAMAKKAMLAENQSDVDLTDSFIGQSFIDEITKSLSYNLPEHQTDSNDYTSVSDLSPSSFMKKAMILGQGHNKARNKTRFQKCQRYFKKRSVKRIWH